MFNKTSTAIIIARHQTNVKNWHQINVQGDTNLQKRISASDKRVLLRDLRYAPAWIAAILRQVAGPEER